MKLKKIKLIGVLLLSVILTFFSFKSEEIIEGWFLAGSAPSKYEIGVEFDSERNSKVAFLKSTETKIKGGFGTIMQTFVPEDYHGKRVKLTAFIKAEDVDDWAGMWMRIDGERGKTLSFDNMQERPIEGTVGWKKYEIILDVSKESVNLAYGVLLAGTGKLWIDSFKFETVDISVGTTGKGGKEALRKPTNTGFED